MIQRAVSIVAGVNMLDFQSHRRTAGPTSARQIAMKLCRELTIRSMPDIGRRFGGRDHTTVLHAVRKYSKFPNSSHPHLIAARNMIEDDIAAARAAEEAAEAADPNQLSLGV
jgi:chromosomal replication initiation ATPase DnaA